MRLISAHDSFCVQPNDLKKEMAQFFLKRRRQQADAVWVEKEYSDAFFESSK